MCIQTKPHDVGQTTKTKTQADRREKEKQLTNFVLQFVAGEGQNGKRMKVKLPDVNRNKTKSCCLSLFFSSLGGMASETFFHRLKCAMIVGDNLCRVLHHLLDKPRMENAEPKNDLEKMVRRFESDLTCDSVKETMTHLCKVDTPFGLVFVEQPMEVICMIGLMHKKTQEKLAANGGHAASWERFRQKLRSARLIVKKFVEKEQIFTPSPEGRQQTLSGPRVAGKWKELETCLETRINDKSNHKEIDNAVERFHTEPENGRCRRVKRKHNPDSPTVAMHARSINASATVKPGGASNKKRRKKKLTEKECTKKNSVGKRKQSEGQSKKQKSAVLFNGETKACTVNKSNAVIVIETFCRAEELVKGITVNEEKSHRPGDTKHVRGKNNKKKLTSVLLCDTTSAHLHAFKRADKRPHLVLSPMAAKKCMIKVIEGENTTLFTRPIT